MEPETRNQRLLKEMNDAGQAASAWGHAHTFLAGLIIGTVLGFVIAGVVF